MNDFDKSMAQSIHLKRYTGVLIFAWTLVVAASLMWNVRQAKQNALELAHNQALVAYEKDLIYRDWNADHGGVYVPVTKETPPNPYLNTPERDITTPSGRLLTLMNPAYMTRQLYELALKQYSTRGHITSLRPIRPENAADLWETESLQAFERGEAEVSSVIELGDEQYMRLMRPLVTEKNCLKCHAAQGFKLGDIRGGISVVVPMTPFWTILKKHRFALYLGHSIIWLVGICGIGLGTRQMGQRIRERKQAENEIKDSREFLESVIENSKDAIIISDEKGDILSLNTAIERISDFKKEELIGKHSSILTVKDKETREKIIEKTAELFEKGSSFYESKQLKDGKYIDVECASSMIEDDKGNYIAGVAIIRDITERKEMEHKILQSEKLRSLGELAGGVAHDFNNVLAAILGRAQLLKMSTDLPPGQQERRKFMNELKKSLEIIEDAARDGAETVRRIQEFPRSRDEDRHFTTIDLNEIIARSLEFTRARWKSDAELKGIKIKIQKELSPLPLAEGSASELREVFTNIINNTLDALPQGGTIKIKTFKEDGQISIKIEDTGVGIPKAIRDRIFDPFFTTKGPQSSGLGMSVSYGIINRHRGTITVDSIEGKGTTFTIKLPVAEKTIEAEKTKVISGEQKKASILVIEDEEQVRNLLSAILTKGGHEVETVPDGPQGIEIFGKKTFDLVFTDLGMFEMSGWQVAEKIKSIDGRMPVILISGWDIKLKDSEMKERWVDLIVHKPFEVDQVLDLVQEGMMLRDRFKAV